MANENLLANVLRRYNEGLAASPRIRTLQRARDRVLTSREVQDAAGEAGEILAQALTDTLSSLAGDGKVTLEQALSLVPPSLRRNHSFLSSLIRRLDKPDGLKTSVPPFDAERAKNLAKRAASYERFADHTLDFSELVENNSRAVVDDAERETAETRYRMGLSPRIRRRQVGGCCEWCAEVEGEFAYDPETMDKRVFRRHRGCDCLIELIRDGRREVVDNYTSWDKRNDQAELRQRIRLLEPDPVRTRSTELQRRRIGKDGQEIIDKPTYQKLTRDFIRQGGMIIRGEEAERHLNGMGAYASYIAGGNVAFIRDDATVSDVLEEMFHAAQDRKERFGSVLSPEVILRREIEAQEYLLSVSEKYKIPIEQSKVTRENLRWYQQELENLLGAGDRYVDRQNR